MRPRTESLMKINISSHQYDCGCPGFPLHWLQRLAMGLSTARRGMLRRPNERTGFKTANFAGLALAAALLLAPSPAQAATNILVNPCFSANSGRNVPTGWTLFLPPLSLTTKGTDGQYHTNDYWIEGNEAPLICGNQLCGSYT